MKLKPSYIVYTALAAVVCLAPSLGMLVSNGSTTAESDNVAAPHLFTEDGQFNVNVMSDAGDWFESNIAFRDQLVSFNSAIMETVFDTSSQPGEGGVITGTKGWLYYADSLNDYQGTEQLTDRELFDIAHSLKLAQDYVESQGGSFAFTIAPNKATLYAANMPYYYANGVVTSEGNYERIKAVLDEEGVNYVDLYSALSSSDEVLYHERDSHWTAKGASTAASELMDALDHAHRDWSSESSHTEIDYTGDLDQMLYPAFTASLSEVHYDNEPQYDYVNKVESNFDTKISTVSSGSGSLVCYRDSFGSALLPFLAEAYGSSYFSRSVPYPLATDLSATKASTVIIERAERFLPEMASNAPLVPAVEVEGGAKDASKAGVTKVKSAASGSDYVKVSGALSGELCTDALIYIEAPDGTVYEASPCVVNGKEGFQALLPVSKAAENATEYTVYISE